MAFDVVKLSGASNRKIAFRSLTQSHNLFSRRIIYRLLSRLRRSSVTWPKIKGKTSTD